MLYDSYIVKIDKKGWYHLNIDTNNSRLFNLECLFLEFEMLFTPEDKYWKLENRSSSPYKIAFGRTWESNIIKTYSCDYGWFQEKNQLSCIWAPIQLAQKLNIKVLYRLYNKR